MASPPGDLDASPPQRRLADTGVTLEHEPGGQRSAGDEELAQGREFGLTPDDSIGQSFAVALKNRGTSPISPPSPRS